MIKYDLHMHTTYCDGKDTPEEMILSGIEKGLETIGFSCHSYTGFDKEYCIPTDSMIDYKNEIERLKPIYQKRINILCGVELDYFSAKPKLDFDYFISSVHYVLKNSEYISVDASEKIFVDAVNKHYNGDYYSFAEDYYKLVADVLNKTKGDIIGHIDLITKFNEGYKLFDETHPRYIEAYKKAVDALIPYGKPFEVNTGAISRGYRTFPYPSLPILQYIKEKGGKVILSSDSHAKETICYQFDKWEPLVRDMGFEL